MRCPSCHADNVPSFSVMTQEAGAARRCAAVRCASCSLVYLDDYAVSRSDVYGPGYAAWGDEGGDHEDVADSKRSAFAEQLTLLEDAVDPHGKSLLDVGTGMGYLLDVASGMGFDCFGLDVAAHAAEQASRRFPGRIFRGTLEEARYPDSSFDVVTLTDVVEHVADPRALWREVRRVTRPGGHVLVITPNHASLTRRMLRSRWFQYKYEHVTYWNPELLRAFLAEHGFETLVLRNNRKRFRLGYYERYFAKYALLGPVGRVIRSAFRFLPDSVKRRSFTNPVTGEVIVLARKRG